MVSSVLNLLGLDELVATDDESYIHTASSLGRESDRLTAFRRGLRKRMEESALRDEAGFTRAFETACLALYRS